jgi:drug/metabolite transporter (DMT)-like permease
VTDRPTPEHSVRGRAWALTGIATIFFTLLGWSSVPLFIKHFASSIDVWTSNGWRYGFSALLWAPVLVWGVSRGTLPAGLWRAARVPALVNAIGQVAFAWAFYQIDPATVTFGLRLQLVFVAIGAYLLFPSERALLRSPGAWCGMAMVLGGIGVTIFLAPPGKEAKSVHLFGVVLAVSSGMFFAAYGLSVRKFMSGFHPVTAFAAISQYTAAVMVALMFLLARDPASGAMDLGMSALKLGAGPFGLLMLSAVIGIALGHVFYYISIARLGVAVSSGVVQLQPFLVAIGQYWLFGFALTGGQIAGGVVAVCGAVLLLWTQWRLTRPTVVDEPSGA